LVKDGGHAYFIRFLDSLDAYPEQRAMAAFVLAVIVDGHRRGQEACISAGLIDVCLRHLQPENPHDAQTEPLLLQWLCLCLGKLWEDFPEARLLGLQSNAPEIVAYLLSETQPEVQCLHISPVLPFGYFTRYLINIVVLPGQSCCCFCIRESPGYGINIIKWC
jgi:regulator-associated protein of mTOR